MGPTLILSTAFALALVFAALAFFPDAVMGAAEERVPGDEGVVTANPTLNALTSMPAAVLVALPLAAGALALWWTARGYAERVEALKAEVEALKAMKSTRRATVLAAVLAGVAGFLLGVLTPYTARDLYTMAAAQFSAHVGMVAPFLASIGMP